MSDKLRTIRLYGLLGSKFGRVHKLAVASPQEAIRALCVLLKGFEQELMSSKDRGIGYAVLLGKNLLNKETLDSPAGSDDIRIAPVVMGSKSAFGQILIGAAIMFAAPYAAGYLMANTAAVGLAVGIATYAPMFGAAIALGGVVQALSPQQKGLSASDGANNGASYNFNGAVNTTAQGNAVPLAYGKVWAGGATISAGIYTEDQA
jgi:predicted phage tail protein